MPRTPILHQPRTLPAQENKTSPKPRNQDTVKRLPGPRLAQKTYSQNSTSSAKKHASDDAPPSGTRRKEVTRKLFLRDKWGGETDGENDGYVKKDIRYEHTTETERTNAPSCMHGQRRSTQTVTRERRQNANAPAPNCAARTTERQFQLRTFAARFGTREARGQPGNAATCMERRTERNTQNKIKRKLEWKTERGRRKRRRKRTTRGNTYQAAIVDEARLAVTASTRVRGVVSRPQDLKTSGYPSNRTAHPQLCAAPPALERPRTSTAHSPPSSALSRPGYFPDPAWLGLRLRLGILRAPAPGLIDRTAPHLIYTRQLRTRRSQSLPLHLAVVHLTAQPYTAITMTLRLAVSSLGFAREFGAATDWTSRSSV
ncbi:hypothetical protein EYR36_003519 [Pleurotus pulmonarius]|nr:hypothetical protein EYR36_003519 [Pleurotus pulmonarius]